MSSSLSSRLAIGQNVPLLLYGTAWKEEKTSELTEKALKHGFKGLDTANYPTAYNEPLTGIGLSAGLDSGLNRNDLFVQSKFTPAWAHDEDKIPFDVNQPIEDQIKESIQQTFDHLKVDYLDSLLLHVPYKDVKDTIKAWKVLETYVPSKFRYIGVSNFTLEQFKALYEAATIKPTILQNRFYRDTGYDIELRSFCQEHGVIYQAFWMIRHNPEILNSKVVDQVSKTFRVEVEIAFYLLVLGLGDTQVLNGTKRGEAMDADVAAVEKVFNDDEAHLKLIEFIPDFKKLLSELA
ncbi:hypothetical protein FAUST_10976 [Fusarium austroamericanum]|uniref:NADP-dependent oxidoreductase domain-containing protein n=1 Tax=Fusarium austroamericanum TaxID=282268 RepID=A0AAN5Z071_FUSAU|nr:hypothetical protein FAUST_10976 [Fusarium austroamericanum]